jgi:uncharacterized membrane protein
LRCASIIFCVIQLYYKLDAEEKSIAPLFCYFCALHDSFQANIPKYGAPRHAAIWGRKAEIALFAPFPHYSSSQRRILANAHSIMGKALYNIRNGYQKAARKGGAREFGCETLDRRHIKETAKSILKEHFKALFWPVLVFMAASLFLGTAAPRLLGLLGIPLVRSITINSVRLEVSTAPGAILGYFSTIVGGVLSVAYYHYALQLIRYRTATMRSYWECIRDKWPMAALVSFAVNLLVGFGLALFLVPGVFAMLYCAMSLLIAADRSTANIFEIITLSGQYMRGYKMDFLVFSLSFFGWMALAVVTFGIAFIWVLPYLYVSVALYYEELRDRYMSNSKSIY